MNKEEETVMNAQRQCFSDISQANLHEGEVGRIHDLAERLKGLEGRAMGDVRGTTAAS